MGRVLSPLKSNRDHRISLAGNRVPNRRCHRQTSLERTTIRREIHQREFWPPVRCIHCDENPTNTPLCKKSLQSRSVDRDIFRAQREG